MSESTLAMSYTNLKEAVALYLGFGIDASKWSTDQTSKINLCIKSGLLQFYFPPAISNNQSHDWSFLHPTTSITTESDTGEYDLPDSFGSLDGAVLFVDESVTYPPLIMKNSNMLREHRLHYNGTTGRPTHFAIIPKSTSSGVITPTTSTTGQRFQIMLSPIPDAEYELEFTYNYLPNMLTSSAAFPLGGAAHAETILQSCLAAAEKKFMEGSVQQQAFMIALQTSINIDSRNQPRNFGRSQTDKLRLFQNPHWYHNGELVI